MNPGTYEINRPPNFLLFLSLKSVFPNIFVCAVDQSFVASGISPLALHVWIAPLYMSSRLYLYSNPRSKSFFDENRTRSWILSMPSNLFDVNSVSKQIYRKLSVPIELWNQLWHILCGDVIFWIYVPQHLCKVRKSDIVRRADVSSFCFRMLK